MLTLLFHTTFQGVASAVGLALGFDVDLEPALWWQRKPKALEPQVAKARLRKVAEVIVAKAQEHAEERMSEPQRKADVKEAVADLLKVMPGFDARALYEEAYQRAVSFLIAQQLALRDEQKARAAAEVAQALARRRAQDEEDISLLLALI